MLPAFAGYKWGLIATIVVIGAENLVNRYSNPHHTSYNEPSTDHH